MADRDEYRRRADALLRQATNASDMRERGRLIDEAVHWHNLAMDARAHRDGLTNDNQEDRDQKTAEG